MSEEFVWNFQTKDKKTGNLRNYVIKRATEDRFEDIVEFMIQYFVPDEALNECKNTAGSREALELSRNWTRKHLKENCSLVCSEENSNEIVGINVMTIHTKTEDENKTEVSEKIF